MAELEAEAFGPQGDASRHVDLETLEAGFRSLRESPRELGILRLIVRRRADGTRETPERVELTVEQGVPDDGWSRRPPRDPEAQLAVMRGDVAELIANGQPLTVFGDNLFVDFDISAGNLPVGTRIHLGGSIVEVTPKPHNGCRKFKQRFGQDALRFVQAQPTRSHNVRGIYWKVVRAGEIGVGGPIRVMSRPVTGE
jgi:hypothetical protein